MQYPFSTLRLLHTQLQIISSFLSLILPKTFPKAYYIKEGILQEITEEFPKRKTILNYSYPFTPFRYILRTFLLKFYFPI